MEALLLAPVPHRWVVVLTIPKRLLAYCLYRRRLLGDIGRVAARTVAAAVRALTGKGDSRSASSPACRPTDPLRIGRDAARCWSSDAARRALHGSARRVANAQKGRRPMQISRMPSTKRPTSSFVV